MSFTASLKQGENTVEHACPSGKQPVGGGFSGAAFPSGGSTEFDGFAVVSASSARWTIYSGSKKGRLKLSIVRMS